MTLTGGYGNDGLSSHPDCVHTAIQSCLVNLVVAATRLANVWRSVGSRSATRRRMARFLRCVYEPDEPYNIRVSDDSQKQR